MNNFSQSIESIVANPWFTLLSFLIAIVGVITAVFYYYQGKKVKSPCYAIRSFNIVRDLVSKIKALEMLYSGKPIKNLTITKIAFWNAGRDTINSKDIPTTEPLIVRIREGCKILDAKIHSMKNPANRLLISTSEDQLSCKIEFEYLDKGEGGVFQLIHTDINDKNIEVKGLIKGAGSPIRKHIPKINSNLFTIKFWPIPLSMSKKNSRIILAIMLFGFPLLPIIDFIMNPEKGNIIPIIFLIFMYWGLGIYLFKRRLPKGFEGFEEEF